MDNLKKGDYGRFHFCLRAKGGKTGFDLMATVNDTDKEYIYLVDNDNQHYRPLSSDIDSFKEDKKPELKTQS